VRSPAEQKIQGFLAITSHFNAVVHVVALERTKGHFQIERIVLNQQNFYLFMMHCRHYFFSLMGSGGLLSILLGRKAEKKRSAFVYLRFSPDASAVLVNDSLHGGQSHACSFEVLLAVKTLKDTK